MGQDWKDNTAHWHFAGIGFAVLKVKIPGFDRFTVAALVFLDRNGSSIEAISGELSDLT